MPSTRIENIEKADLTNIVELHLLAFPYSFLTKMGEKFLLKFFHIHLNNPDSFGYAAFNNDFAVVKQSGLLLRFSLYSRGKAKSDSVTGKFELSSIAVRDKGKGIGTRLLNSSIEKARQMGCKLLYADTDSDNNDPVITFYLNRGFELQTNFESATRKMSRFCYAVQTA